MNRENPPELCECCEEYYQYRNGLCFDCWIDGQDRRAEERHDRRVLDAVDCVLRTSKDDEE